MTGLPLVPKKTPGFGPFDGNSDGRLWLRWHYHARGEQRHSMRAAKQKLQSPIEARACGELRPKECADPFTIPAYGS
jgi:hypothetical protein